MIVNPKLRGAMARGRYFLYFLNGNTVADALNNGITRRDLRWDVDHGFVRIAS